MCTFLTSIESIEKKNQHKKKNYIGTEKTLNEEIEIKNCNMLIQTSFFLSTHMYPLMHTTYSASNKCVNKTMKILAYAEITFC